MADQFDVSPERRKVIEENTKRRLVLRNEFLKSVSNPFRHASGEGGTVFDPAMQRYNSMKVSMVEHFRPTAMNAAKGLFFTILPIIGFAYLISTRKAAYEKRMRNGEVAYKERDFKLI